MSKPPALIRAYLAFSRVAAPLWALALRWRVRRGKEDASRLLEKWGHATTPRPAGQLVWLHGVSVGETTVLLTLLDRLSTARPGTHFLLTSVTRASADALANRILPPRVLHQYAPIDTPGPLRRFLDHWRPDLFVLSEMDLWPRLLLETRARRIPMLMLNAHITPRRWKRRRRIPQTTRWLMEHFDMIHLQDDRSHAQFATLGAPVARMQVTGLLKAASAPPPDKPQARADLAAQIGNRPVWLAASTRSVEEAQVLRAHAQAVRARPDMLLILAPRQVKEADRTEVAAREIFAPDQIARRSRADAITPKTQVYIADTLGEMGLWYRLVPVAYPGQSLPVDGVTMGGKNPFEALGLGVMVVHGPQTENFRRAYDMLRTAGASLEVNSATKLADAVVAAQDEAFRAPYLAAAAKVRADVLHPLEAACRAIADRLENDAPAQE